MVTMPGSHLLPIVPRNSKYFHIQWKCCAAISPFRSFQLFSALIFLFTSCRLLCSYYIHNLHFLFLFDCSILTLCLLLCWCADLSSQSSSFHSIWVKGVDFIKFIANNCRTVYSLSMRIEWILIVTCPFNRVFQSRYVSFFIYTLLKAMVNSCFHTLNHNHKNIHRKEGIPNKLLESLEIGTKCLHKLLMIENVLNNVKFLHTRIVVPATLIKYQTCEVMRKKGDWCLSSIIIHFSVLLLLYIIRMFQGWL